MRPLGTTLERTLNRFPTLNVYNKLDVFHFITLKHALSSCVRKTGGHIQTILLNTGVMFLAQGRRGGYTCSICQIKKTDPNKQAVNNS